jgi:HPt (histidine-containing phosphotransfer) domain-containing protein
MQMHTLKGTSATLGDHSLMAVASRLEQMCRTASPSELLTEVAALDWAAQASLTAFNAQIAALPEEPAANAASGPVDVAAVRATFRMLKPLLAAHDLGALDLFARQLPALQTLPAALLRPLEQALQSFEMETALGLCTAIEAQLDLPD